MWRLYSGPLNADWHSEGPAVRKKSTPQLFQTSATRRGPANIQNGNTGALKETRPKSEHKRARRRGLKQNISLTQQRVALSGANA
eukprot:7228325-Pyramimonas_sp.AAC.1